MGIIFNLLLLTAVRKYTLPCHACMNGAEYISLQGLSPSRGIQPRSGDGACNGEIPNGGFRPNRLQLGHEQ